MRAQWIIYMALILMGGFNQLNAGTRSTSNGEKIGLLIIGTIVHGNNKDNVALVKEMDTSRVLAVKAKYRVLRTYTVVEVQTKYILLKNDQGDQHLVYQDKFASDFIARTKTSSDSSGPKSYYSEDGFERRDDKVNMTSAFRDKVVEQDLSKILMQATALPYYENGALKGFKLLQIDKGSIFENGGFSDDDVITAINGQPLNSVPGAIKLLHSLKKESSIQVEFFRGGNFKNLTINVN